MTDPRIVTKVERRLERCVDIWELTLGERMDGGYLASVYECRDATGQDLVLKLSPPIARPDLEARALAAWDGDGAVTLKSWDEEGAALLLDRIRPGDLLSSRAEGVAVEAAAETFRLLHANGPCVPSGIPGFREWLDWFIERVALDAEPDTAGVAMLPRLSKVALHLDETTKVRTLVHGDFISKNLLLSGDRSYVAVDPMPCIGDPCSDLGFFSAYCLPATGIAERANTLARLAGMDPDRCMRWAAVWAIGEACETWREDSDELQAWVSGPECEALLSLRYPSVQP